MKRKTSPTRRSVIKTGSVAAVMMAAPPMAMANIAPQLPHHSSREVLLEFDVVPGIPGKLKFAARPMRRPR